MASAAPTSSPAPTDFRPIYAIFEGGGAKGITHVGALKALELERRAIVGVAGSSAGAIIAALVAVGYTADEIFAPDGTTDILKRRGLTPVDLLGRGAWRRFRVLRYGFVPLVLIMLAAGAATALLGHAASRWVALGLAVTVLVLALLLALTIPVLWARALFRNDTLKETLNDLLLEKLDSYDRNLVGDGRVCFRHIDPSNLRQCARLKIVVSDARSGQLKLFDHELEGGNAVVADAVAASAAIPFVFPPTTVGGTRGGGNPLFVDGGLVSNLPAWSLLREKKMFEREQGGAPIPIVAFSLNAATPASPTRLMGKPERLGLFAYASSVIRTGIFGSQRVVEEFVADLITVGLPSPLGTLDFDCSREEALAAYEAGLTSARTAIARLDRISTVTTRVLEELLAWVEEYVAHGPGAQRAMRLRMCLVDPLDRGGSAFRVVASVGMSDDPDDRLELDGRNDLAPRAFRTRSALYGQIKGRAAKDLMMTKYERALVCQAIDSAICVPIWPPGGKSLVPERVLCLDSTEPLQGLFRDSAFMGELGRRSVLASRTLIES